MTFLVDSHCHLGSLNFPMKTALNLDEIISRAHMASVTHMLCVACMPQDFYDMMKKIKKYKGIYTACGIHPLNIEEAGNWTDDELRECLKDESIVALGETGLDYFYASETRDTQISSFVRQIAIAHEMKLPLIIHAREAHKDTVDIMRNENCRDLGGVMHCYCDGIEMARECLDMGYYISFSGIATFKAGDNVREVIKYIPDDRLLVETDCPYLAPVPVRGNDNEPAYVHYTLDFIAKFKGVTKEYLAERTSQNFMDLFKVELEKYDYSDDVKASTLKLDAILDNPLK